MKKFIFNLVLFFVLMFSFTSCVSTAYAQGEVYEVYEPDDTEVNVVIHYGTPYYYEGSLVYYLYDGWYYYPYLRGNRYYYYRYSRPLPHHGHHFNYRYHGRGRYVHHGNHPTHRGSIGGSIHRGSHNHGGNFRHGGGFNRGSIGRRGGHMGGRR